MKKNIEKIINKIDSGTMISASELVTYISNQKGSEKAKGFLCEGALEGEIDGVEYGDFGAKRHVFGNLVELFEVEEKEGF